MSPSSKEFSCLICFSTLLFRHLMKTFSILIIIPNFLFQERQEVKIFVIAVSIFLFKFFICSWPSFTISFSVRAESITFSQIFYLFSDHLLLQIVLSSCLLDLQDWWEYLSTFLWISTIFSLIITSSRSSLNFHSDHLNNSFLYEKKMKTSLQIYINFFSFKPP